MSVFFFFFFKQKTAYEMRISDWSSDVCSSDLRLLAGDAAQIDAIEFVRTVAVARLMMPKSVVRLSAGRESMSDELQALCFLAGSNSIFLGDKLLTTPNAGDDRDSALFEKLGVYGWNQKIGRAHV